MKKKAKIILHDSGVGFFSDFLSVFAGVMYCVENDMDYYVDWKNSMYDDNNTNLYNKYFVQKKTVQDESYDVVFNRYTPKGLYFNTNLHFNQNIQYYNLLHHPSILINQIGTLESDFIKNIDTSILDGKKVLGVHKRGTDHNEHGEILSDVYFLEKINLFYKNQTFDKILLITDDLTSYEFFNKELKDMVIFTDSIKTNNPLGLHRSGLYNKNELSDNVLKDSILLANTDFKLVTKSNVSTFSLLCNLESFNFDYIDKHIIYR